MKVIFKSNAKNWHKEFSGAKCNTIRKKDSDERFKLLDEFIEKPFDLEIEIKNAETDLSFTRKVSDVTVFYGIYIISWRDKVWNG